MDLGDDSQEVISLTGESRTSFPSMVPGIVSPGGMVVLTWSRSALRALFPSLRRSFVMS